jgi:hypothetical protein
LRGDGGIDSVSQSDEIQIDGADEDSRMILSLAVELHEVFSVQRQDGALVNGGGVENILVAGTLPCPASLLNREHVVSERT